MQARRTLQLARPTDEAPVFSVDSLVDELRRTARGLDTGWRAVDDLEVRFRPKELALLAARTGHGKTSALVNIAMHWLEQELQGPILFYSHEEPPEHILCRLTALLATGLIEPWTVTEIRDFLTDPNARGPGYAWPSTERLETALAHLRTVEQRLIVVHKPGWSAERLASHAREVAESRGVGAVFVDYLQRLPFDKRVDGREQEISLSGRTLKSLAVDLGVPVVAGAQINREAVPAGYQEKVRKAVRGSVADAIEEIKAARPDLHHLREGGSEQEVDLVLGLMNYAADLRTEANATHATTDLYEVGVLKNRYGAVGRWAALSFSGPSGRICDREPE
jgi:replicative DNA helicase